jgi:hypothetical protein
MIIKKYQPIIKLLIVSILAYLMHKLFFYFNSENTNFQNFHASLESIYVFFFLCSVIIIYILIQVKAKSQENVGYVFLLVTCIKMGLSYLMLSPIAHSGNQNAAIEKINFFIIFALFLAIETILTIRILNNKQ